MWSSLFGLSKPKNTNEENDQDVNDENKGKKDAPQKHQRVSRSWLENPIPIATRELGGNLEGKTAQHNMLDSVASMDQLMTPSSMMSANPSKRFNHYVENCRVSSRPLYIVRQSDSDILRFKEDHFERAKRENQGKFISIPILPADEMNSLTSDIKLWQKNRRSFKVIFSIAVICGLITLVISGLLTTIWYAEDENPMFPFKHFDRHATQYYNLHMNAQVSNLLLMTFGLNIFRLLPQSKLTRVIAYHVLILLISFGLCMSGIYWAIVHHEDFTQNTSHFYSLHSWIGLTTCIFYLICFITGFFILYYPGNKVKESHSLFAIFTFMLTGAAAIAGFFYRALLQFGTYYRHVTVPGVIVNIVGVVIVVFCIFVRLAVASFMYRRRPKPQWDVIVYRSMEAIEDVYLEIYDMYDSFELWIKQVNQARLRALRVPHTNLRSSSIAESDRSGMSNWSTDT